MFRCWRIPFPWVISISPLFFCIFFCISTTVISISSLTWMDGQAACSLSRIDGMEEYLIIHVHTFFGLMLCCNHLCLLFFFNSGTLDLWTVLSVLCMLWYLWMGSMICSPRWNKWCNGFGRWCLYLVYWTYNIIYYVFFVLKKKKKKKKIFFPFCSGFFSPQRGVR